MVGFFTHENKEDGVNMQVKRENKENPFLKIKDEKELVEEMKKSVCYGI